jgi:hypothetical protein
MPKRSSKGEPDINQLAAAIVAQTTNGDAPAKLNGKNPAAVALGRLGGLKGGVARAKKLNSKRRSDIAKKAARARWLSDSRRRRGQSQEKKTSQS